MSNPTAVLSQIDQALKRLEAMMELLMEKQGIEYDAPIVRLESPKPTKTYVLPPPPVTAVTEETAPEPETEAESEPEPEKAMARRSRKKA